MGVVPQNATNRHHSKAHLRCSHQVHFQESGLKATLSWTVILEGIQKEGGALLDHVHLHEDINNLIFKNQ